VIHRSRLTGAPAGSEIRRKPLVPRVAMFSFSARGGAEHADVEKVRRPGLDGADVVAAETRISSTSVRSPRPKAGGGISPVEARGGLR